MTWTVDVRVANYLALAGSVISIFMFISPLYAFWLAEDSVYKRRSSKHVASSFAIVSGIFNCLLWNSMIT
jgi:hypothetical protein